MTPLDAAQEIASYIKQHINERLSEKHDIELTDYNIYAGFLPYARTSAEVRAMCPAIVVRPDTVQDSNDETTVKISVYVTTYDDDMSLGHEYLYHLLERVRYLLLSREPINNRYIVQDMKTTIPDEQPFPQWLALIEFTTYIPAIYNERYKEYV